MAVVVHEPLGQQLQAAQGQHTLDAQRKLNPYYCHTSTLVTSRALRCVQRGRNHTQPDGGRRHPPHPDPPDAPQPCAAHTLIGTSHSRRGPQGAAESPEARPARGPQPAAARPPGGCRHPPHPDPPDAPQARAAHSLLGLSEPRRGPQGAAESPEARAARGPSRPQPARPGYWRLCTPDPVIVHHYLICRPPIATAVGGYAGEGR